MKKNKLNSVRAKIMMGFSLVLVFVILLGAYNFYEVNNINKDTEEIASEQMPLLIADEKMAYNMVNRNGLVRAYLLYEDEKYRKLFEEGIEESIQLENDVLAISDSDEIKALIEKKIQWGESVNEVLAAYDSGNKEEALRIMETKVSPLVTELVEGFETAARERESVIYDKTDAAIKSSKTIGIASAVVTLLVVLIGILVSIYTARLIAKPITTVMNRMKSVASGELNHEPLQSKSNDEIGQLVQATNEMNANMRDIIQKINEVSETVTSQSKGLTQSANEVKVGAEQIATTMEELATGTETQANSASDLSAGMSSFTTEVQEANENGAQIDHYSKDVLSLTNEGSDLMKSSTLQMQRIDEIVQDAVKKVEGLDAHSQKISNLVLVIKDIAEQTNLLALNAAIEAARAGEHGKGFAVVADEVRKLAEQVSVSVTDITGIVENIQHESSTVSQSLQNGYREVEQGTTTIDTTGQTFAKITDAVTNMVASISTVTTNLSNMATNSQEMSSNIEEIAAISEESAAGVEQTSASAQQVSGSMEEIAGNSEQLSRLAEELNALIGKFKI
ncbi:methyl-accepting chemotaxis protein [Ornithinibacillus xuwenensis]|uniref:Methyl-accepting chemotaxis protein n=1 Tax=Ornithinibacillus xuwenensis TaxID=3144668 RepID=A0ABU9XKA1_9BACI